MASLVTPELEEFDSGNTTPAAQVKPQPKIQPLEQHDDVTNNTVLDSKGNPSRELPDFLEEAEKMETAKANGEEVEQPKKKKVKEEPEKEQAKETPEKQETETTQASDDEVAPELLKVLPKDKPLTAKRIQKLLQTVEFKEKSLAEKDAIIKELQSKTSTTQGSEEITKIKEELDKTKSDLLKYRRRYDLDSDPEVKSKFDEPVVQAEKSIAETLNRYNLGEQTLKIIEGLGGFAEFSKSGKVFTVKEQDPNDPNQVISVQKTAGDLVRSWLNAMAPADSEYIRSQMSRQFTAKDDKKRFFEKETAEADKYFKEQEERQRGSKAQEEANLKKIREEYTTWAEEKIGKLDWMKLKDVPANSTPEQRKNIEEHNAFTKQLHTMLKNPPTDSKEKVMDTLLGGVEAHHLRRENGSLKEQIKAMSAELEKLKGGLRTTSKTGSLMTSSRKPEEKKGKLGLFNERDFEESIRKAESGEGDDE